MATGREFCCGLCGRAFFCIHSRIPSLTPGCGVCLFSSPQRGDRGPRRWRLTSLGGGRDPGSILRAVTHFAGGYSRVDHDLPEPSSRQAALPPLERNTSRWKGFEDAVPRKRPAVAYDNVLCHTLNQRRREPVLNSPEEGTESPAGSLGSAYRSETRFVFLCLKRNSTYRVTNLYRTVRIHDRSPVRSGNHSRGGVQKLDALGLIIPIAITNRTNAISLGDGCEAVQVA
jgi:hypothetical protein